MNRPSGPLWLQAQRVLAITATAWGLRAPRTGSVAAPPRGERYLPA